MEKTTTAVKKEGITLNYKHLYVNKADTKTQRCCDFCNTMYDKGMKFCPTCGFGS